MILTNLKSVVIFCHVFRKSSIKHRPLFVSPYIRRGLAMRSRNTCQWRSTEKSNTDIALTMVSRFFGIPNNECSMGP